MSQDHHLQQQRFELKYLIPEKTARAMRPFLACHLELDDYAAGSPDYSYNVHSLYLDSPGLHTHFAAVNGQKNRFKLRLRYYKIRPEEPIFFEVKGRMDNCILKQRCGIHHAEVPIVLAGGRPAASRLLTPDPKSRTALDAFMRLTQTYRARPRVHNAYRREAWVSPHSNAIRVTFDRRIVAEPHFDDRVTCELREPVLLFQGDVVLEIKFTSRFPDFLREMVERYHLMQLSSAKYSSAVEGIGENRLFFEDAPLAWRQPMTPKPLAGGA